MIYLKKLSLTDGMEIYTMLQEIAADDNGFHNKVFGMTFEQFNEWLLKEYAVDNGELQDWMVPQTSYWLFNDNYPIGYGRIRHFLNETLAETSGHIGYAIRNTERQKGYGNVILSLLLEECKKLNLQTVQIGANRDNIASNRIIINHCGKLIRSSEHKNFYHIDLLKEPNTMTVEKSCGAVVFTRSDEGIKYVIIANEVGYYGFPKGHMEDGETETETAYREIFEETGLHVTIIDGFRTTDSHPHVREGHPTVMKHMVYFLAEYSDQQLVPQEGEVSEITLMTYEEAMAKFQFESSKRILREADEFLRSYKGEQA